MGKTHINPDTLNDAAEQGYTHVVASRGGTTLYISGQAAFDKDMNLIGAGDFETQVGAALENLRLALKAANATIEDLVRMDYYIVDYKPDYLDRLAPIEAKFFGEAKRPASTILGVQALAMPGPMIEVDATAVIDNP